MPLETNDRTAPPTCSKIGTAQKPSQFIHRWVADHGPVWNLFWARHRQLNVLEARKPLATVISAKKGGENDSKIPGWMEIFSSPQGIRQDGSTTFSNCRDEALHAGFTVTRKTKSLQNHLVGVFNFCKRNSSQTGAIVSSVFENSRRQINRIFARALARYSRHQARCRWLGMDSVEEHWPSVGSWTSRWVPASPDTAPPDTVAPRQPWRKHTRC